MIVIDKPLLKFVLAGRAVDITVPREHKRGKVYSLGTRHNSTICRVQVVNVEQHADGWRITIKQMSGDEVRLLPRSSASTRGYVTATLEAATHDTRQALRGGLVDEPEPIDAATLERYAAANRERDDSMRRYRATRARVGYRRSKNTSDAAVKWSAAPFAAQSERPAGRVSTAAASSDTRPGHEPR